MVANIYFVGSPGIQHQASEQKRSIYTEPPPRFHVLVLSKQLGMQTNAHLQDENSRSAPVSSFCLCHVCAPVWRLLNERDDLRPVLRPLNRNRVSQLGEVLI